MMNTENIENLPKSFSGIEDGKIYLYPDIDFSSVSRFTNIAFKGDYVIKIPSEKGYEDYRKFIINEIKDSQDIRTNEPIEKFEKFSDLLRKFEKFRNLSGYVDKDYIHYLLVHKLQHERLNTNSSVRVPKTKFIVFVKGDSNRLKYIPVIIQEKIKGTSLWAMFDHYSEKINPVWESKLPLIATKLKPLLKSDLRNHLNWNIENLILTNDDELYYVDSKPSTLFSAFGNRHNIRGIKEVFLRQLPVVRYLKNILLGSVIITFFIHSMILDKTDISMKEQIIEILTWIGILFLSGAILLIPYLVIAKFRKR